jgi:hypothetical protein
LNSGPSYLHRTWLLGGITLLLFVGFLSSLSISYYWKLINDAEKDTAAQAYLLAKQTEQFLDGHEKLWLFSKICG